jgi:hypothetical protein
MAHPDNTLSAFCDHVSKLTSEGERLLHNPSLSLDERAALQRASGYLLEARLALEQLATPSA